MTFTVRVRGARPQASERVEYVCADHGRFELELQRPLPDHAPCPECQAPADFAISACRGKVKPWEVVRGRVDKPERETWQNWENLGEGQELSEWQADRAKVWDRHRENSLKELMDG